MLAKTKYGLRERDIQQIACQIYPLFRADPHERRRIWMGAQIRKGAADAIENYLEKNGGTTPPIRGESNVISNQGGTPLVVAEADKTLGIIHLKDIVKGRHQGTLCSCARWASSTVMITGDNPLTAAAIAAEAAWMNSSPKLPPRTNWH